MRIVQVQFPRKKRPYTYNAQNLEFDEGATLVVEGPRGNLLATAVMAPTEVDDGSVDDHLPKVIREAKPHDINELEYYRSREEEAEKLCLDRIASRKLPMKLVDVEYLFDGSKVIFYFTAEGRVDFRELVRDLARDLKTRIEMVQIGVRDEAKMVGGLGVCGKEFCCCTFLDTFMPVSIKMAKDQCLSLNPAKVSGVCGRLMCCLSYEHPYYIKFREGLPKVGKRCMCPYGPGKISRFDIVKHKVVVQLEDGREVEVDREEVSKLPPPQ
jgi:cell fate regulator YaaT (PSP1 superfamily)